MTEWGYCRHNGPKTWCENVPAANGISQSPINIVPSDAVFDQALKDRPLEIVHDPSQALKLINTGRSVQVTYNADGSSLEGGPLEHKYKVAQFHFHWGKTSETGSEHRINDVMYAAEAHIVHYNSDLYESFGDAAAAKDGLAVLGAFVEVGEEHAAFKKLTDQFDDIAYSGDSIDVVGGFDPSTLLPDDKSKYWTYSGSLTTPPCYESVRWIVFREPIKMSEEQLTAMRNLRSYKTGDGCPDNDDFKGKIVENYRPPLSLNERSVRRSFQGGSSE